MTLSPRAGLSDPERLDGVQRTIAEVLGYPADALVAPPDEDLRGNVPTLVELYLRQQDARDWDRIRASGAGAAVLELSTTDGALAIDLVTSLQGGLRRKGLELHPRNLISVHADRWDKADDLVAFASALARLGGAIYGMVCATDEEDAYNREGYNLEGLDRSRYLPGLYWWNHFGVEYCDLIGREKLLSAPCEAVAVGNEVQLCLGSAPQDWESKRYQKTRQAVLDHIGREYFFDREHPDRPTVAPDWDNVLRPARLS